MPENTPLPAILSMLHSGVVSVDNASAAMRRLQPLVIELSDVSLTMLQAEALEDYLSGPRCPARELVLRGLDVEKGAFRRLCAGVARHDKLIKVIVTGCRLSDEDVEELANSIVAGASPVRVLDVGGNALGSPMRFIDKLRRLPDLERLVLSNQRTPHGEVSRLLCVDTLASAVAGSWSRLTSVAVENVGLDDEEKEALLDAASQGTARYAEYGGSRVVTV